MEQSRNSKRRIEIAGGSEFGEGISKLHSFLDELQKKTGNLTSDQQQLLRDIETLDSVVVIPGIRVGPPRTKCPSCGRPYKA